MRLFVTGAAGFIGSNFARHVLDSSDDAVTAFDALTYAGNRESLRDLERNPRFRFVHGDITDAGAVDAALAGHDAVVHFAAESHNSLAVLDPSRFVRTNVLGTQALLDAARRADVSRFVHISTCEVYGDMDLDGAGAFSEDSPYRPRTPYNASKAAADHVVRSYHHTFGVPTVITNCCNNYGPYQFPEKVIPLFVTNAIEDQPLPLYASIQHRREWIHVLDHCRAVQLVLTEGVEGETYHVGTGVERSIDELADAVLATLGKPAHLRAIVADRPGHDRRYLLDSSKIRSELGWKPHVDFEAGLAATIEWYVRNRPWWEPLRGRAPVVETAWVPGR